MSQGSTWGAGYTFAQVLDGLVVRSLCASLPLTISVANNSIDIACDAYTQAAADALLALKADSSALTSGLTGKVDVAPTVADYTGLTTATFYPILLQLTMASGDNSVIPFHVVGEDLASASHRENSIWGHARVAGTTK